MNIRRLVYRQISIPLKFRFAQSNNPSSRLSSSIIVELHTEEGVVGYGEACPRLYVTGESAEDVLRDLRAMAAGFSDVGPWSIGALRRQLRLWEAQKIGPSALCAFELAWLDAWSRTMEKPLAGLLEIGHLPEALSYSLVLPLVPLEKLPDLLNRIRVFSPPSLKLKVDARQEENLERVRIIRDFFGPDIPVRVDVNGGWSLDEALDAIPRFLALGVRSFEQPLPPGQEEALARLTRRFGAEARIMADESLLSRKQAEELLAAGSCNHFNLKISKMGGIFNTMDIFDLAVSFGVPCQLGAHFGETSLLTGAGVLVAAMAGGRLTACEGALGDYLLEEDIASPAIRHDPAGMLALAPLAGQPGLVRAVNPESLARYTVSQVEI